jgi:hypothetical protein
MHGNSDLLVEAIELQQLAEGTGRGRAQASMANYRNFSFGCIWLK